jgi:hypothetical protein
MGSSGDQGQMRQVTERWVSQDSVQQDDRYTFRVFLVDSSEASVDHRHELGVGNFAPLSGVLYMFGSTPGYALFERRRRTTIGDTTVGPRENPWYPGLLRLGAMNWFRV